MDNITAVVIGAGARGMDAYINKPIPGQLTIVGVAEPNDYRRKHMKEKYDIPSEHCFNGYEELLNGPKIADLAIICTPDRMHYQPAKMAIEKGYHIMLEKPISPIPSEVYLIGRLAEKHDKVFSVCHVLRYTSFYSELKRILDSGTIGKLISVVHCEDVGYWHQAHSFVRGNWGNNEDSSPMILQKCCHDMDLLVYLVGSRCKKISSFGSLTHFKPENAPSGAPLRCTDGCPAFDTCQFNAVKLYLGRNRGWAKQHFDIEDGSDEAILKELTTNRYGRCVYRCNNNVVDHQVVNMEFENEETVSFTMCAFTESNKRISRFLGVDGEICCDMGKNTIVVRNFKTGNTETIIVNPNSGGHGGGDYGIMTSVINAVLGNTVDKTSVQESVQSHMMAFAAEESRLSGRSIDMNEFVEKFKNVVQGLYNDPY